MGVASGAALFSSGLGSLLWGPLCVVPAVGSSASAFFYWGGRRVACRGGVLGVMGGQCRPLGSVPQVQELGSRRRWGARCLLSFRLPDAFQRWVQFWVWPPGCWLLVERSSSGFRLWWVVVWGASDPSPHLVRPWSLAWVMVLRVPGSHCLGLFGLLGVRSPPPCVLCFLLLACLALLPSSVFWPVPLVLFCGVWFQVLSVRL